MFICKKCILFLVKEDRLAYTWIEAIHNRECKLCKRIGIVDWISEKELEQLRRKKGG